MKEILDNGATTASFFSWGQAILLFVFSWGQAILLFGPPPPLVGTRFPEFRKGNSASFAGLPWLPGTKNGRSFRSAHLKITSRIRSISGDDEPDRGHRGVQGEPWKALG